MDRAKSLQMPVYEGAHPDDALQIPDESPGASPYPGGYPGLQPSSGFEDLSFYRMEFPFVDIMQIPNNVRNYILAAGTAVQIDIPDGSVIGQWTAYGDVVWYDFFGRAAVPVAGGAFETVNSKSIFLANGGTTRLFYLGNIKSFSAMSPGGGAGAILSLVTWTWRRDTGGIFNRDQGKPA